MKGKIYEMREEEKETENHPDEKTNVRKIKIQSKREVENSRHGQSNWLFFLNISTKRRENFHDS